MLELYYASGSLCSQKVKLVLAEKGLTWRGHRLNLLTFENLAPAYMALNLRGVVPTLVHSGRVVTDSAAIIHYLEEAFPQSPLTPAPAAEQAAMQVWLERQNQLPMRELMYGNYAGLEGWVLRRSVQIKQRRLRHLMQAHPELHHQYAAKLKDVRQWHATIQDRGAIARLNQTLEPTLAQLEAQLTHTDWLAGPTYSLADGAWTAVLNRLQELRFGHLWATRPALNDYVHRLQARPSFTAAIQTDAMPLPMLLAGLGRTLWGT